MTSVEATCEDTGPGGETPSAQVSSEPYFSVPEFSLRYSLNWRDALVWEGLPGEVRGPQKAIYIGFQLAGGMVYGLAADRLPDWIATLPHVLVLLVVMMVMHGLWLIYRAAFRRYRARRRIPHQTYCVFEDWGDHIYIHDARQEVSLSADLCRQMVVTPTHIFIDFADALVIVPAHAFDTSSQRDAFVAKWQRLEKEARDWPV